MSKAVGRGQATAYDLICGQAGMSEFVPMGTARLK